MAYSTPYIYSKASKKARGSVKEIERSIKLIALFICCDASNKSSAIFRSINWRRRRRTKYLKHFPIRFRWWECIDACYRLITVGFMLEILCESKEYERVKCFDSFPFRSLTRARSLSRSPSHSLIVLSVSFPAGVRKIFWVKSRKAHRRLNNICLV